MARNSNVPRSQEHYITQVSEEIEGRVTKRLSKKLSRTENRILGALACLGDFLMNPLIQDYSGNAPETSRNAFGSNQGTKEDHSQSDPHPKAGLFDSQITQNSGPKDDHDMVTRATERHDMVTGATEGHDMMTGVQRESPCGNDMMTAATEQIRSQRDMVTGATKQIGNGHHMMTGATEEIGNPHDMTGVHEEVTYCSPSTSSGKQKHNRSTSQPQFGSENTPATIEAYQTLLDLQQLADNNNSANFHNNINRTFKLPKSLATTMPTLARKSEKFELFEDIFQTSIKIFYQLTEDDRINYFHSLMRGDALQTFRNINGPTRENLGEILAVFRRKYKKPQSMATATHKFQRLVFNPAKQTLLDFLDDLQKQVKDEFGIASHAIIEHFINAKMPPHLKKSINKAHLEIGTYEQIVIHLEKELELNGLEAPDEQQINIVSQHATNSNADRPKLTCHLCKKNKKVQELVLLVEKTARTNKNYTKYSWR